MALSVQSLPRSMQKIAELWSTSHKVQFLPTDSQQSDHFRPWLRISLERINVLSSGKWRYQLQFVPHSTTKLDELCSIINKVWLSHFDAPKVNTATNTDNAIINARLMQLRSGHGTLIWTEFQPPKLSHQLDLLHWMASRWALPQICF